MTNKAYIVANAQQERDVLEKLEQQGLVWNSRGEKPTEWVPSHDAPAFVDFPIILTDKGRVSWAHLSQLDNEEIVYDGRNKYIVSQKFMDALKKWKDNLSNIDDGLYISPDDFIDLPVNIMKWRDDSKYTKENNNRLIAIIRWVNGEDVFEIEKPKKWVVRSKEPQGSVDGEPLYIWFVDELTLETETEATMPPYIRRFNTKEEAQSWANSHQEVIEVEE